MSRFVTILIVDDEELIRLNLRALLEDLGYGVLEAANGREGLAIFDRDHPDLVLSDLRMPVMDGLSMIAGLKEKNPETPVIVVSGTGTVQDAVSSLRLGAWDYILKPVTDIEAFKIVIARTLEKAQLVKENQRYQKHLEEMVRERTKELHDSEARYRRLLESVTSYVYTVIVKDGRPDTTVHYPGCEAITGYTLGEYAADPYLWYRMVLDDDRVLVADAVKRIFDENLPISLEHRFFHMDGTVRWVQNTLVPHRTAAGELLSYDGIIVDITERKKAEEKLFQATERWARTFDAVPDLIAILDTNYKIMQVNKAMADRLGCSPKECAGQTCYSAVHGTECPIACCPQILTLADKQEHVAEVHEARLGGDFIVSTTPICDRAGRMIGSVHVARDITERKRAEEALRQSEERYRMVFENSPVSIWEEDFSEVKAYLNGLKEEGVVDIETYLAEHPVMVRKCVEMTKIVDVNLAALALHEAVNKEELLAGLVNTFTSESFDTFRQMLTCLWNGKMHLRSDSVVQTLAGNPRNVTVYSSVCPGYEETFAKVVVSLIDITDRKRAEQEKEKLQLQFLQAQKMESVGRLAGGVAHDFNNMLGVIIGYADLALEEVAPGQPVFDKLQQILNAAERSAALTRQLLAFARKQTISPKVLDLNESIESMLKLLRRLIGENIGLAWLPGKKLWPVKMDPAQIDQMLANLCVNARDAIAGVGKITIETGKVIFDEAYCSDHRGIEPGEFVLLAVSDDGQGMDEQTLGKIFEPFFTTKEMGKGTGLGLATVYGIIKQNNGCINVLSEPGRGTALRIYLPRYKGPAIVSKKESAAKTPFNRGETVLIVEDEPEFLRMTKMMLENLGFRVLTAGTSSEAIALAEEYTNEIHLLLTDVIMPEMNGRDLAERLQFFCPSMKILFVSGYTSDAIIHQGVLDEGVNFIQKPFSLKDLAVKLQDMLKEK